MTQKHAEIKSPLWIVMGVSGCGKSTVARALAGKLSVAFWDADDYHPPTNVEKMRRGEALTDDDREPWLETLNQLLRGSSESGESGGGGVLACSALRRAYRHRLAADLDPPPRFVHLAADFETIHRRMKQRDHFMPADLLQSQFETLEPPTADEALVLDAALPVDQLVAAVVSASRR